MDTKMIEHVQHYVIPAAHSFLPDTMASTKAIAHLLTIGEYESAFEKRLQGKGPARGLWQFEISGVRAVMTHPRSMHLAAAVIEGLRYKNPKLGPAQQAAIVHIAVAHNDTLACALARLTMWTVLHPLPAEQDFEEAWAQYLFAWNPNREKADKERFRRAHNKAWALVKKRMLSEEL
jgi:hypothetical protein